MSTVIPENFVENLDRDGFAIIDNLFTPKECDDMIKEMRKVVEEVHTKEGKKHCFQANVENSPQAKEDYFMKSCDTIGLFYEESALTPNGDLKVEKEYLAINKVAHGIHRCNELFKKYTFDERIKEICRKLKMQDPVLNQSMFIFKNAEFGGEVKHHQDSSYIYTEPINLHGVWIALEDVTTENGCLWFMKGSHKGPLYRKFIRNPDKNAPEKAIYEGKNPEFNLADFTPAPVKKGSAVVLHGKVIHYSAPNISKNSRNIYTFHIFDQHDTKYSEKNWNIPAPGKPFLSVYKN